MSIKKQQFSGCCFHCFEAWDYSLAGTIKDTVIVLDKGALYCVQTGAYKVKSNADIQLKKIKAAGFDAIIINENGMYKIQSGAYGIKANAERQLARLRAAGFDAFIS